MANDKQEIKPINNTSLSKSIEQLGVKINFQVPQLSNYDEVYANLKAISDRYSQVIIPDAEQAKEIAKRGGLLTQMRKVERQVINMRTQVHREAKNAYADFDDKINTLSGLIHSNINHMNTQVNNFKQKQDEDRFEEIKNIFNNERNSYQFKKINGMFINFDQFYDKKMLHNHKDNKIKELAVSYLSQKSQDNNKTLKFFSDNPEIAKMSDLVNSFRTVYNDTNNIEQAIATTLEQKVQIDKLIKERSERLAQQKIEAVKRAEREKIRQEQLKQAQLNQAHSKPTDTQVNHSNQAAINAKQFAQSQPKQIPKGVVSFEIADLTKANMVKEFLDKNNIKFNVHFKSID